MRNYNRFEEDLDEYEDEEDQLEEYEEEPLRQQTQEELEYLELRQRLKESIRKQMKKEGGSSVSTQEKIKTPYDNYGSFFGPSQPVISQRVIQESKSLIENQHLASRMLNGQNTSKKTFSTSMGSKPANVPPPKAHNGLQTKLKKLKDTRDYSFLLSDDAELPAPKRQPPPRNASIPISDAKSAQFQQKSKGPSGSSGRLVNGSHQDRKAVCMKGYERPKLGPNRPPSGNPNSISTDPKKQIANHGSGPGRPLGPKGFPSKTPTYLEEKASVSGVKRYASSVQKPPSSMMQASVSEPRIEQRREPQECDKSTLMKKQSIAPSKYQINKPDKPISSHAAETRKVSSHLVDQRKVVCKAPIQKKLPPHVSPRDQRQKKRPARPFDDDDDDEDGGKAISMIRKMFGYNPNKYRDDDDDDSNMEAGFDDIMKEEEKSALIARKEDEEQLRLIEEEEKREMLRKKMAKKRKLMSH